MNILKSKKSLAGLIAIIMAAVLIIGGGTYLLIKKFAGEKELGTEKAIEDIGASIPKLDFSLSPLPDLNASALNIAAPQLLVGNVFSAPSVNSDFSYNPDVNISVPSTQIDIQIPSIPASSEPTASPTSEAPASEQPQVDCSQFASVPSCSMTGSGEAMCKQCYPNK